MGNPASRAIVRLGDLGQGGSSRQELVLKSFAFNEAVGSFIDRVYFVAIKTLLSIGCQSG